MVFLSLLVLPKEQDNLVLVPSSPMALSHSLSTEFGYLQIRAAAWDNLILVWSEKLDLEACSSLLLLRTILNIHILKFNILNYSQG